METRRRWYTGLVMVPRIAARTLGMMRNQRLSQFVPFMFFLMLGSFVLWIVNAIAPLAPFVYSLF